MRILSVRIENLRCFADSTVPLDRFTALLGANGAGKSTVLCALNVFFRENTTSLPNASALKDDDFHQRDTSKPVRITVTFGDLSEEAQEAFKGYYRNGQLSVTCEARMDAAGTAITRHFGQRLVFPGFADFFKAQGDRAKAPELKSIYGAIREQYGLPSASTIDGIVRILRDYEEHCPEQCVMLPSEDQFYGAAGGSGKLQRFVQWVYIPAVKDATSEELETRHSALGKLLERQVRNKIKFDDRLAELQSELTEKYSKMLAESQHVLDSVSASLQARLIEFSHPEAKLLVTWQDDDPKAIRIDNPLARVIAGEGDFMSGLGHFGHGLQRSYLLALLHELATMPVAGGADPTLILGCEEPELYQHPPQARYLGGVMRRLSEGNCQVIITTHSPYFIPSDGFESIRMIRRVPAERCSQVSFVSYENLASDIALHSGKPLVKEAGMRAKVAHALQPTLSEMFFTSRLILVEGIEDCAYLNALFELEDKKDSFRRNGLHVVPVSGKSELLQAAIIAKRLGIPTFIICDGDRDKASKDSRHLTDNTALLSFAGLPTSEPIPQGNVWGEGFCMWVTDIGGVAKAELGEAYSSLAEAAATHCGHIGRQKNTLFIGFLLALAWDAGKAPASLRRLCDAILEWCSQQSSRSVPA